ncbi:hypothetical protein Pmani_012659 [Petrolisthes manimaculis]|uniref:Uncharacterized protein n=1 Tax=Petrolisthes manimaculis TaxID=1843537 RepID=A0AAE1PYL5_9EUCA|nr:hypothetical protein Pmani_012659 [Petrolisthes manimaculis]
MVRGRHKTIRNCPTLQGLSVLLSIEVSLGVPSTPTFILGCVPLAFDQPRSPIKQWVHFLMVCSRSLMSSQTNLQCNGWVQWLAGTRACPHTAVPLGHTAAPRSPAGLAWSRKTPSYRV